MFWGVTTLKLKFGPTKISKIIEIPPTTPLSWENVSIIFPSPKSSFKKESPETSSSKWLAITWMVLNVYHGKMIGNHQFHPFETGCLEFFSAVPWFNISKWLRCHTPNLCALEMSGSCRCTDPDEKHPRKSWKALSHDASHDGNPKLVVY